MYSDAKMAKKAKLINTCTFWNDYKNAIAIFFKTIVSILMAGENNDILVAAALPRHTLRMI